MANTKKKILRLLFSLRAALTPVLSRLAAIVNTTYVTREYLHDSVNFLYKYQNALRLFFFIRIRTIGTKYLQRTWEKHSSSSVIYIIFQVLPAGLFSNLFTTNARFGG